MKLFVEGGLARQGERLPRCGLVAAGFPINSALHVESTAAVLHYERFRNSVGYLAHLGQVSASPQLANKFVRLCTGERSGNFAVCVLEDGKDIIRTVDHGGGVAGEWFGLLWVMPQLRTG